VFPLERSDGLDVGPGPHDEAGEEPAEPRLQHQARIGEAAGSTKLEIPRTLQSPIATLTRMAMSFQPDAVRPGSSLGGGS